MKLGISMWSYYAVWKRGEMDIPGFIREAKRLEVEGVELLDFFWKDREKEIPAIVQALSYTGLRVGVYSVSNNFALTEPADRAKQIEIVRQGIDTAIYFGADVVRVFAGNARPGLSLEDASEGIIDGFRRIAPYAESKSVTLALENHGLLAGKSAQVIDLLDKIDSPFVRANPDTGNFLLVHDKPQVAVSALASRAAMVHFKDFHQVSDNYQGAAYSSADGHKFAGTAVGEGDVALAECVSALKTAGFQDWLNIEYEAEEDPRTGVARSVYNTKKLMEN